MCWRYTADVTRNNLWLFKALELAMIPQQLVCLLISWIFRIYFLEKSRQREIHVEDQRVEITWCIVLLHSKSQFWKNIVENFIWSPLFHLAQICRIHLAPIIAGSSIFEMMMRALKKRLVKISFCVREACLSCQDDISC